MGLSHLFLPLSDFLGEVEKETDDFIEWGSYCQPADELTAASPGNKRKRAE